MLIDSQKDIQLYSSIINSLGQIQGTQVAAEIFAEDFGWEGWEVRRSKDLKTYTYKIIEKNGQKLLVNERDLKAGQVVDILEVMDQEARGGLEFAQMDQVRKRLLSAEIGTSTAWISPKKILPEDPNYALTFLQAARKIDTETILVAQSQDDFDLKESASLLNLWAREKVVETEPSLEELMLAIPKRWEMVTSSDAVALISGALLNGGRLYVEAIQAGLTGSVLSDRRQELLKNTIDYNEFIKLHPSGRVETSCGTIDFNTKNLPSWVEKTGFGEFRCKLCQKNLSPREINSHRCIC